MNLTLTLALVPVALSVTYAFAVWRVYRGCPAVRTRLGDARLELAPADAAEGFARRTVKAGSLLVPGGVERWNVPQDDAGEKERRSKIAFRDKGGVALIQVTVMPRRASSLHLLKLPWARTDGCRLLESALVSRFNFFRVVMRSLLVRGLSEVSLARVTIGGLHGFMRRGFLQARDKASPGGCVHQFDLFDATWHYKLDTWSFHGALPDAAVLTVVASYRPPWEAEAARAQPTPG